MLFTFKISGETHTLGNLLSEHVEALCSQDCFSSYLVPHPLTREVHIQIESSCREEASAKLRAALDRVVRQLDVLLADVESSIREPVVPPSILCVKVDESSKLC